MEIPVAVALAVVVAVAESTRILVSEPVPGWVGK